MSSRIAELAGRLEEPLLVTNLTNIFYLTGFDTSKMEYDKIGVLPTFPYDVTGR